MIGPDEIALAHERIRPYVRATPVIDVELPDIGPVTLKLELLQHSGSFKTRGAFNTLLSDKVPAAGVVAASGGNHGAAVAYAAHRLGIPARIFVPTVSSPVKIARIESYGAKVTVAGERYADALALAEVDMAAQGALGVHAYATAATVAGQGTIGIEWQRQTPELDTVLVAVGGGGLISGIAAWYRGRVKVIGVEPAGSKALKAALDAGEPVDVTVDSIAADSLGAKRVGEINYEIAKAYVAEVLLVPDSAIEDAQRLLWRELRIAAEPGGAAALAALVSGAYRAKEGERVGVLVCGGNVGLAALDALTH